MSKLLDCVRRLIRTKHYSYRTEQSYVHWIKRYIVFHKLRHPAEMGAPEVTEFLSNLAIKHNVSASTQNQALAALLFLYRNVLSIDLPWLDNVVRAKKPTRLPVVLTKEETRTVLAHLRQQDWLMASLLYGSGLRLKECLRLRIKEVDFGYKQIVVRDAKGNRDRVTMLPASVEEPLRQPLVYVRSTHKRDLGEGFGRTLLPYALAKKYPHSDREWGWQFVFPANQRSREPRSKESYRYHVGEWVLQKAIKEAVRRSDINKRASCHTLRHQLRDTHNTASRQFPNKTTLTYTHRTTRSRLIICVYLRNLCAGMLQFLNISNIALIDELQVEFEPGLNLLTGETGSGKSIIVDALGVLIGGRFTSDLLKSGAERGSIEGLFILGPNPGLEELLANAGVDAASSEELIIRRELSATGRNKIFINNQLATHSLLRDLREFLVDIHGQGDQQTLFNPHTHLDLLDSFAIGNGLRDEVADAHRRWMAVQRELDAVRRDDSEKFQLVDTLKFQIEELERSQLVIGEGERLEEERRRLANVEKLTALCQSSYARIYEDDDAAVQRVRQTLKEVTELTEYESTFREYLEGLESASAVLEDLSFSLRDFADKLEFSPARLAEVEDRLAELARLKRKYGGSIQAALEHLARSEDRLRQIETSDEREQELTAEVEKARGHYFDRARKLHRERVRATKRFEKTVENCIAELAMDHARFQVQISDTSESASAKGIDYVEFHFCANAGEDLKPLARVASGGEASRLMLVLKTVANATEFPRTIVFDEIDSGIGGRVSEAVGIKLRKLAETNQVLCVTHQPQIARFADSHLAVQKAVVDGRTQVDISKLNRAGRIEELARMLTGAEITDAARRHARELLKTDT